MLVFFSPLETQRNNFASKFGSNQEGEKDVLFALYSLQTEGDERRKHVDLASCKRKCSLTAKESVVETDTVKNLFL